MTKQKHTRHMDHGISSMPGVWMICTSLSPSSCQGPLPSSFRSALSVPCRLFASVLWITRSHPKNSVHL